MDEVWPRRGRDQDHSLLIGGAPVIRWKQNPSGSRFYFYFLEGQASTQGSLKGSMTSTQGSLKGSMTFALARVRGRRIWGSDGQQTHCTRQGALLLS